MPTHLSLSDHVDAITASGRALRESAARSGLAADVPTCAEWDVRGLVAHLGMVHRWAAANLRGDDGHRPEDSQAEAAASDDLLGWFAAGLDALVTALHDTPDDAAAMVFLRDAPPPRQFWARRQAHETTIHAVDAISAELGRWPRAAEVPVTPAIAADGIDELLCGFLPRRKSRLRSDAPYTVVVRADDTGHAWTLRVSQDPVVTTVGDAVDADAVLRGSAAELYLGLWNRGDEIRVAGREDVLDQWRSQVQVRWR
ncbi:MAG: maleylpyruvate isomerase N-terminal domain-containing protein [Actinomycetota bacterium]